MIDTVEIARNKGVVLNRVDGFNNEGRFPAAYTIENNGNKGDYFIIDDSRGWETMRHAYALAAAAFNELVPLEAAIPTF